MRLHHASDPLDPNGDLDTGDLIEFPAYDRIADGPE